MVLVAAVFSISRGADVAIWQNASSGQSVTSQSKVTIQGHFYRLDMSPAVTCLLDGDAGYVYQILNPGKVYSRQNLAQFSAASPCADATNAPVATGNSSVIGGYKAYEYRQDLPCGVHIFWVAPDYPGWQKLRQKNAFVSQIAAKAGFRNFSQELPGMVVQSQSVVDKSSGLSLGGTNESLMETNTLTLVSIIEVPDDASITQIPAG